MEYADSNIISNNFFRCLWIGFYGHSSSNNNVFGNNVIGPGLWGIMMGAGSYNVFHDNYVANFIGEHDGYGIAIGGNHLVAQYNTFYHNVIVGNNKTVGYNWGLEGAGNAWDNGSVGNFWSDYNGTDTNGDGLGDTPYSIAAYNVDRYPVINQFTIENVAVQQPTLANPAPDPLPTGSPQNTPTNQPAPTQIQTPTPTQQQPQTTEPPLSLPTTEPQSPMLPILVISAVSLAVACVGLYRWKSKVRR